jgi:hypothetical protein
VECGGWSRPKCYEPEAQILNKEKEWRLDCGGRGLKVGDVHSLTSILFLC